MSSTYLVPRASPEVEEPISPWDEGSFRRILVVFDGSKGSWKALRTAISLAWQHDADLWALSLEDGLPRFPATVGEAQEEKEREDRFFELLHKQASAIAEGRGVRLHSAIAPGRGAAPIVRFARNGDFDLIVIGADTGTGWWGAFLGKAGRVGREAHCAVMIVR